MKRLFKKITHRVNGFTSNAELTVSYVIADHPVYENAVTQQDVIEADVASLSFNTYELIDDITAPEIKTLVKFHIVEPLPPELKPKVGGTITFPPDNNIPYFQDSGFHSNIPPDVEFTIEEYQQESSIYWLRAFGYGIIGAGACSYGNGSIGVSTHNFANYLMKQS